MSIERRSPAAGDRLPAAGWSGSRQATLVVGPWQVAEYHVLRLGLMLSAGLLVAALAAFMLPSVALGHWAGTHLALAGAALVAVGTFMPHFAVTLAGSLPEPVATRLAGILALAAGTSLVVAGVLSGQTAAIVAGAVLVWAGLAITAWTTFRPMRQRLARRHPMAALAYAVALLQVAIGIGLPVLFFVGWEPAVAGWPRLRPAHVWLNLFGFLSLTIAATLVYLYPTVVGARIRANPGLALMVAGLISGPPLVAAGLLLPAGPLATLGALATVAGAVGQLGYGLSVWGRRAGWTTDAGWHRLAAGHLSAGMAWFGFAAVFAAADLLGGTLPPGWSLGALAMPLIGGWVIQVLVGAWTYLLPAVAARGHQVRAAQRAMLGRWPFARLAAWNVGILLAWAGLAADALPVALAGVASFTLAALASAGLLLAALLLRQGEPVAA